MDPAHAQRLFDFRHAFDHPVTLGITVAIAAALILGYALVLTLRAAGRLDAAHFDELQKRIKSWAIIAPLMIGPVLLGAAWTIAAVALLSLLCYREYARATGLFRHRSISITVVLGIAALTFATLDHWYNFFVALTPLTICLIAAVAILADQPSGYIQRVALGFFGFLFCGTGLAHLGYIANDPDFRPIILLLLLTVEMNDIFAYISGKLLGRRKLAPHTSPNKTLGGALGALVLTTALVCALGHFVFKNSPVDTPLALLGLGVIISITGQLGDLMLSSVKRDLGIKDMSALIPGHGGLLDRFDSLLIAAPAVFHYVGYLRGFGLDLPSRIFTG